MPITINVEYETGKIAPVNVIPYQSYLSIVSKDYVVLCKIPKTPGSSVYPNPSEIVCCYVSSLDEPKDIITLNPFGGGPNYTLVYSTCLSQILGMQERGTCSACTFADTCYRNDANTQYLCTLCRYSQTSQTQQNNAPLPTANPSIPKNVGIQQVNIQLYPTNANPNAVAQAVMQKLDEMNGVFGSTITSKIKELPCPTCSKNNYTDAKCCWWCGSENITRT